MYANLKVTIPPADDSGPNRIVFAHLVMTHADGDATIHLDANNGQGSAPIPARVERVKGPVVIEADF